MDDKIYAATIIRFFHKSFLVLYTVISHISGMISDWGMELCGDRVYIDGKRTHEKSAPKLMAVVLFVGVLAMFIARIKYDIKISDSILLGASGLFGLIFGIYTGKNIMLERATPPNISFLPQSIQVLSLVDKIKLALKNTEVI